MTKKIIAFLLCGLMLFSAIPMVHAAEVGAQDEEIEIEGDAIHQEEDDFVWDGVPNEEYDEDRVGPTKKKDPNAGSMAEIVVSTGSPAQVPENTEIMTDTTGEGTITFKVNVPDDFYENILVELRNRATGDSVKVPVYASNQWTGTSAVPAGSYIVFSVLATGDDELEPEWIFEVGSLINIEEGSAESLNIKLLSGPNGEIEVPDATEEVIDTKIDGEPEEELTLGQRAWEFFKGLVTGSNFVLLLTLAASSIAYLIIKKKQDED